MATITINSAASVPTFIPISVGDVIATNYGACASALNGTIYIPVGFTFANATVIWTSSNGTGVPTAGFYYDGTILRQWDGVSVLGAPFSCDGTPPSTPLNLVTSDTTPNNISWDASTDDATPQGNIEYYLERADDSGFTTNLVVVKNWTTGVTSFDDKVPILAIGNTYYYRVKARDSFQNESSWSITKTSVIEDSGSVGLGYGTLDAIACANTLVTHWFKGAPTLSSATTLWINSAFTIPAPASYYADSGGTGKWRYWNGAAFTASGFC